MTLRVSTLGRSDHHASPKARRRDGRSRERTLYTPRAHHASPKARSDGRSAKGSPSARLAQGSSSLRKVNMDGQDLRVSSYHGPGHHFYKDGDQYLGNYVMGDCDGQGLLIKKDGSKYKGEWYRDMVHGDGVLIRPLKFEHGALIAPVSVEDQRLCSICYENSARIALDDCGHVCSCEECATYLDKCPICRKPIKKMLKIFYATR